MSAVVFLLLALAIIVVGSALVYFRQRTPSSLDAGIDGFRREMEALAVRQGNGDGVVRGIHSWNRNGHGGGAVAGAIQSEAPINGNGDGNGDDDGARDDAVNGAGLGDDLAEAPSDEPGAAAPAEAAGPPGPARGKG